MKRKLESLMVMPLERKTSNTNFKRKSGTTGTYFGLDSVFFHCFCVLINTGYFFLEVISKLSQLLVTCVEFILFAKDRFMSYVRLARLLYFFVHLF